MTLVGYILLFVLAVATLCCHSSILSSPCVCVFLVKTLCVEEYSFILKVTHMSQFVMKAKSFNHMVIGCSFHHGFDTQEL